MAHYKLFVISPDEHEIELAETIDAMDENLIPALKGLGLLSGQLSESCIQADFDRGTWMICVVDVPPDHEDFGLVLKLVGPWNESMGDSGHGGGDWPQAPKFPGPWTKTPQGIVDGDGHPIVWSCLQGDKMVIQPEFVERMILAAPEMLDVLKKVYFFLGDGFLKESIWKRGSLTFKFSEIQDLLHKIAGLHRLA